MCFAPRISRRTWTALDLTERGLTNDFGQPGIILHDAIADDPGDAREAAVAHDNQLALDLLLHSLTGSRKYVERESLCTRSTENR